MLNFLLEKEIGASGHIDSIGRNIILDLTAGDAVPLDGQPWRLGCSPGIYAGRARFARKPLISAHWEIKPETFGRLAENMARELPGLGYHEVEEHKWRFGDKVDLYLFNRDAGEGFDVSKVRRSDAVYLLNDPNAMTSWAMKPGFAASIERRTGMFRSMSTMGCNVNGIMRLRPEERAKWFDLLREQEVNLPSHRDLYLVVRERDASKWGFLLSEPVVWRSKIEAQVSAEFRRHEQAVTAAWFKAQPEEYAALKDRLFLTAREREAV